MQKRICPKCGSRETASILWGEPAYSEELEEKLKNKEIVLGGCCITNVDPTHHCFKCKKDFGCKTNELELLTSAIEFSIGGFHDGYQTYSIIKDENTILATYKPSLFDSSNEISKELTNEEWIDFVKKVYRCYVDDWKSRYEDPNILDGTQWELTIKYNGMKPLCIYGSNSYPPHWKKFLKVIKSLDFSVVDK